MQNAPCVFCGQMQINMALIRNESALLAFQLADIWPCWRPPLPLPPIWKAPADGQMFQAASVRCFRGTAQLTLVLAQPHLSAAMDLRLRIFSAVVQKRNRRTTRMRVGFVGKGRATRPPS